MGIRAITVCVGYDDFLRLTLPRIVLHVDKLLVVTTATDARTHALAAEYPDKVELYCTDAFYRNGASFNKGLAMEEGFDVLGREGWILILDADIVLPAVLPPLRLTIGKLYTPVRRILSNPIGLTDVNTIKPDTLPVRKEHGNFGYFQLFHANDPVIRKKPWYGVDWVHAGGCDSVFEKRWAKPDKLKMPFEVIHLGDPDNNWFGRSTLRIDNLERDPNAAERLAKQNALHRKYGWKGFRKTGEAVVERIFGSAGPEPCHDHDKTPTQQPRTKVVRQRHPKAPSKPVSPNKPATPPPATTPPVVAMIPAVPVVPATPPLRKFPLPPRPQPRLRGLKD